MKTYEQIDNQDGSLAKLLLFFGLTFVICLVEYKVYNLAMDSRYLNPEVIKWGLFFSFVLLLGFVAELEKRFKASGLNTFNAQYDAVKNKLLGMNIGILCFALVLSTSLAGLLWFN